MDKKKLHNSIATGIALVFLIAILTLVGIFFYLIF